jgi:RHS repeat-associated protein
MISASGPGSATASFGRDGRNRDVKRTIDGVTTYLIYDGWNLVAEYNAAGTLTTQYIHGPRVDEILAKVTPTSTTFPLPDALGSTIAVTDASGAVLERVYYFDAFGTPTFRSGTGVPLPDASTGTRFLFTGREWFARLGLYDYRNRTYSPRLGRFVQTDPIGFSAREVNLYRYVSNSAINLSDPEGLETPSYDPDAWNDPAYRDSNNCYSYACNRPGVRPSDTKPQPGDSSGRRFTEMTCSDIIAAAKRDGLVEPDANDCCPNNYHKVSLHLQPDDYHWYREDSNGQWSHKQGHRPVGEQVSDPNEDAAARGYSTPCGTLCAPN